MPRVSVLISAFEQPRALACCLIGYQGQTFRDFEIIVADDGSAADTCSVIERFQRTSDFAIRHVWQPNHGFRKAKIVNEAARISQGSVLMLTDADCIPPHDLLDQHVENCRGFCVGGRIMLTADYCRTLTEEQIRAEDYAKHLTPRQYRRLRRIHWKNRFGMLAGSARKPKVLGCNLSVTRDAFYAVNGYDENFAGFGGEDSDLRDRLRRHGSAACSLWDRIWVYHLDPAVDKGSGRPARGPGGSYYHRKNVPLRCENGLFKMSAENSASKPILRCRTQR